MSKLKDWMMPLAMLTGGLFSKYLVDLSFLTPYLIFVMLVFTYNKLSPRDIGINKLHLILIALQLIFSLGAFWLLSSSNLLIAQGFFICLFAPTASAAAVITSLLYGNVAFVTTYTMLSNFMIALLSPFLLSYIHNTGDISFMDSTWKIFEKTFPMLFLPLILAWIIRYYLPKVQKKLSERSFLSFYLWIFALMIVTAKMVESLKELTANNYANAFYLSVASLICCVLQFFVGKKLGGYFDNRIASGQSLGQKNTILAIWLTQSFLPPLVALAPSMYILWQNIINSVQVARANKKEK